VFGDVPFNLTATGGTSGNPVTFVSSNTAVATVSGGTVTIVGAGTTTITASQAGNANYNAAADVPQTLTVNKANQTITFNALPAKVFGDIPFTLGATASSTLPVTYTSSNTAVATVSGNTVTIVGAGTTTITAAQAGNTNYNAAASVPQTLTVNKANQSITFNALPTKVFGDVPFALGATASSTLAVSYSSSNTAVATVSGSTVTIVGAGTTTITASQAGNANYNAAADVTQTLTVNKANQTITFNALPAKVFGDIPFTLGATASSTLPVTYTSSNTAVATVSGNTVTIVGAGSTTITASQAGTSNYNAAIDVLQSLVVNKATLTATADPQTKIYGDVNPTLTISYTGFKGTDDATVIDTNPTASVPAGTMAVVGSYTITPSGGTDNNYSFSFVNGTLTVTKAPLTATADDKTKIYLDANPPLTITYTGFKGGDNASILDSAPSISTLATTTSPAGPYTISLTGGSDHDYAISDVSGTLTINKGDQIITFNPLPTKTYGDSQFLLSATGGATGNPVTFSSSNSSVATVFGNVVTIVGGGVTTITASQAGNANYNAAVDVPQTLTVNKAAQSITFNPIAAQSYGTAPFSLTATSSSGLPVTYVSSNTAVATISGNTVTIVGVGTTTITASQAGNTNFNAAVDVPQDFTVNRAAQTITFNAIASKKFGDLSFTLGATASSSLPISYVSSDLTVATISGNTVSIIGVGTTTITASQAGNANYFAAADVLQNFTVNPSPVAVTPPSVAVCYGTTTTLTASGAQSYTWSPASGLSATTGTSVLANPKATTTYTVTGTYPNGQTASTTVLVKVNAIPLAAGGSHSIVMYCGACGGGVTASGLNTSGQLGDGTTTQRISPVALSLTNAAAVSAGASHTLYLKNDGTVWASGLNTNGQLGDGTTSNKPSPVQVIGFTGIVAMSAGNNHSLFLKGDGTVWACGLNSSGQLGDGTTVQKPTPFQIATLSGIIRISGGGTHSLFLKNDGTVYACGNNGNGQLGDGSKVTRKTPVVLPTLSGIIDLSAGGTHSHFLKNDGTVLATGLNSNGQLGDGTTTQRTSPVAVSSMSNVASVSGGATHTLFLKNDGTAWATGLNTDGQLGDGTTAQLTTPVLITSLTGVTALDAGATHSLFLKSDGFAWACGRNLNGQIGDGTTTGRPTPVPVENVNPCGRIAANSKSDVAETDEEPQINLLNAYPNPTDEELTVVLPEGAKLGSAVVLFDGMGRPLIEVTFNPGEKTTKLNTSKLAQGMYFLNVQTTTGPMSRKVLVLH